MAISYTRYVDATSQFAAADSATVNLGGLVIVPYGTSMKSTVAGTDAYKVAYDGYHMVELGFGNYLTYFATSSVVGAFAERYFNYISTTGAVARKVKIVQRKEDETPLAAFKRIVDEEDAFGSFTFLGLVAGDLTATGTGGDDEGIEAVAAYNQSLNNLYRMVIDVSSDSEAVNYYTKFGATSDGKFSMWDYEGLTFTLGCSYITMAILAATNYNASGVATVQMFKKLQGETAEVSTDSDADLYDGLNINYYGLTKSEGREMAFYQAGFNADGTDTACYDNETWFKRTIIGRLLYLETNVERIPPNPNGVAMVLNVINAVITRALDNGVILPSKPISEEKKAYVTQLAGGNPDAVGLLNRRGYITSASIETRTVDGKDKYVILYRVIYLKGDSVRKIEGTHNII